MSRVKVSCEIEVTLSMIGGKYKPLILYYLIGNSPQRFGKLKLFLDQISQKTLTNQLRELEADGLISRTIFPEIPPRVEYAISDKGLSLFPILELMCEWGCQHIDERFELLYKQCD